MLSDKLHARGQARYRTPDLPLFRRMLYLLSYLTHEYCSCNICTRRRVRTPNLSICVSSALPVELGGLVGKEGPSDPQSQFRQLAICSRMRRVTTTLGAVLACLARFIGQVQYRRTMPLQLRAAQVLQSTTSPYPGQLVCHRAGC